MKITTKEIVDKVQAHLLAQNARALDEQGHCMYRTDDDRQCAVGCLIKPHHYHRNLEGNTVDDYRVQEALKSSLGRKVTEQELGILIRLQAIHDSSEVEDWEAEIKAVRFAYEV